MIGSISLGSTRILSSLSIKALTDFGYAEKNAGTSEGNPDLDLSGQSIESQSSILLNCQCDHKPLKLGTIVFG